LFKSHVYIFYSFCLDFSISIWPQTFVIHIHLFTYTHMIHNTHTCTRTNTHKNTHTITQKHTHKHTHQHKHTHTQTHTNTQTNLFAYYISVNVHTHEFTYMHSRIYVHTYEHESTCICLNTCTYLRIHIWACIYTHTREISCAQENAGHARYLLDTNWKSIKCTHMYTHTHTCA